MRKLLSTVLVAGILFITLHSVGTFGNVAQAQFEGVMRRIQEEDKMDKKKSEALDKKLKQEREKTYKQNEEDWKYKQAQLDEVKDKIVMKKWQIGKDYKLGDHATTDWTTRVELDLPDGSKINADVDTGFQIEISEKC